MFNIIRVGGGGTTWSFMGLELLSLQKQNNYVEKQKQSLNCW